MEPSLRALGHVKIHSIIYTLKNWKKCFSRYDKLGLSLLIAGLILTSWQWTLAASKNSQFAPSYGGTFIEGVIGNDIEKIDLGHLVKSSLVKVDQNGELIGDMAEKWQISEDNLSYTFELKDKVSSSQIISTIDQNPTYFPKINPEFITESQVIFKLDEPDGDLLSKLTTPVFPNGPYKLDKKTKTEVRLKANREYFGQKPYISRVIFRLYANEDQLQNAARRGKISASLSLLEIPENWQSKKIVLNRKHFLFINSSKQNLKSIKVRESILAGEKPSQIEGLDVLEVNGVEHDLEYEQLKEKLISSGVKLNIRQVSMKDALIGDLPKRNYDILYILLNGEISQDPYEFYHSNKRSSDGQNFAEVANAALDTLTTKYRQTSDKAKREELMGEISKVVADEKISVEYRNLEIDYAVSPKIKGLSISEKTIGEVGRFDNLSNWYILEKRK
ncbi:MAG: Bacterial extracellular solute-binding proteins, family 5 Middle [candidate division WS2 bacterium ADurb.Bin280]|uniref:Bacterial extracellular solute-binding proteins, family 5 Middle n=1 Tax=candidate division WS2 bacterium ADurb.Bin280 TaxID=1852829 RepID=A0A1V5SEK0_9BACT|nr:MAG: Bacterial extracellular solute-binding proteins, family 5 Middle [candidate division WS2 bacterium ADurb.Bin280]